MKTTLHDLIIAGACSDRLKTLLGKYGMYEPIDFKVILKLNGIYDTIWCLRTQPYKKYCLFLAEVCEYVLPIYMDLFEDDVLVLGTIQAIHNYHDDLIGSFELEENAIALSNHIIKKSYNMSLYKLHDKAVLKAADSVVNAAFAVGANSAHFVNECIRDITEAYTCHKRALKDKRENKILIDELKMVLETAMKKHLGVTEDE